LTVMVVDFPFWVSGVLKLAVESDLGFWAVKSCFKMAPWVAGDYLVVWDFCFVDVTWYDFLPWWNTLLPFEVLVAGLASPWVLLDIYC
jgi:hypothetical protein